VKVGLEAMRGIAKLIEHDLREPSPMSTICTCSAIWPMPPRRPSTRSMPTGLLEKDLAPRARATFRLGRERFEEKLRLDEGITLSADRLLAIAERELHATQEEFRRQARASAQGTRSRPGARSRRATIRRRRLVSAARGQLEELVTFIRRNDLVSVPEGEPVQVAPTPDFYRWSFASMWTPGPFESKPTRAYYYLTDVDPSWPAERQLEHLRDFNLPTLWSISIHEVYPGTSCTTSTCARSTRSCANRRCSRRRRSSRGGRTMPSR